MTPETVGTDKVTAHRLKDDTEKVMEPLNKNQP